jgi:hypothetical protein
MRNTVEHSSKDEGVLHQQKETHKKPEESSARTLEHQEHLPANITAYANDFRFKEWFQREFDLLSLDPSFEAVKHSSDTLEEIISLLELKYIREQGGIPAIYTAIRFCEECGPVWLEPWTPLKIAGCPWCFNRGKGLPIPHPKAV